METRAQSFRCCVVAGGFKKQGFSLKVGGGGVEGPRQEPLNTQVGPEKGGVGGAYFNQGAC